MGVEVFVSLIVSFFLLGMFFLFKVFAYFEHKKAALRLFDKYLKGYGKPVSTIQNISSVDPVFFRDILLFIGDKSFPKLSKYFSKGITSLKREMVIDVFKENLRRASLQRLIEQMPYSACGDNALERVFLEELLLKIRALNVNEYNFGLINYLVEIMSTISFQDDVSSSVRSVLEKLLQMKEEETNEVRRVFREFRIDQGSDNLGLQKLRDERARFTSEEALKLFDVLFDNNVGMAINAVMSGAIFGARGDIEKAYNFMWKYAAPKEFWRWQNEK